MYVAHCRGSLRVSRASAARMASGLSSQSGLRIGSTISDVRRAYGAAPIVDVNGKPQLGYSRSIRVPGTPNLCDITTAFVMLNGKVAQIERISGF